MIHHGGQRRANRAKTLKADDAGLDQGGGKWSMARQLADDAVPRLARSDVPNVPLMPGVRLATVAVIVAADRPANTKSFQIRRNSGSGS